MSQFWHANWAEDAFQPKRLQNWEVPRWHCAWPDRHCTTTKFQADNKGRLLINVKKSGSLWGNFKGTWELPLKIDRCTAEKLSNSTEYKKEFWNAHKAKHERICERKKCTDKGKKCSKNGNKDLKKSNEKGKSKETKMTKESCKSEVNGDKERKMLNITKTTTEPKCKITRACKL